MEITVWTKSNCVQCDQTKKQFDKLGIKYKEQNLEENLIVLEDFKAKGLMSAPIVTTDTKAWSGFRIDKINSLAMYLKSQEPKN